MTHQPATPGAAVAPPPGSSGEKIPCESDSGRPTSGTLVAPVFYPGIVSPLGPTANIPTNNKDAY